MFLLNKNKQNTHNAWTVFGIHYVYILLVALFGEGFAPLVLDHFADRCFRALENKTNQNKI